MQCSNPAVGAGMGAGRDDVAARPAVLGAYDLDSKLKTPLRAFLRTETGGALVLLSAAIAALVWVNATRPPTTRFGGRCSRSTSAVRASRSNFATG